MGPPQIALEQLAPTVIGVMWMQTFLAAIFVWGRVYARYFMAQAGLGWDDAFMVISWVSRRISVTAGGELTTSQFLFVAYSASMTAATHWGFGHHMDELVSCSHRKVASSTMKVYTYTAPTDHPPSCQSQPPQCRRSNDPHHRH